MRKTLRSWAIAFRRLSYASDPPVSSSDSADSSSIEYIAFGRIPNKNLVAHVGFK